MNWFGKKRIFLDYASATPVLPEVKLEMDRFWSTDFYNPNAIYEEGVKVKRAVTGYRTKIARLLGVREESVIFTSGGTEANVLAINGVNLGKIIIEPESHPSVTEAAKGISSSKVTSITLYSSVTTDNKLGRKIREERKKNNSGYPLLHIDASQTAQYFNVSLETLACDLLTLDSAKIYGPKGIGALIVRRGVNLNLPPQGTPSVPLIAGFAKALEIAVRDRVSEFKRLETLSNQFVQIVKNSLPDTQITKVLPNTINVSVPGVLPEFLVLSLEKQGVLVSAGPACNFNKPESPETPVRFSFGRFSTSNDIRRAGEIFCRVATSMLK